MSKTIERIRIIHQDHERVYSQLIADVLPQFYASYNFKVLRIKVTTGKVKLINISDRDDWKGSKAIVQMKLVSPIGLSNKIGSPIKIYCQNLGSGSCSVSIIADKQSFLTNNVLNTFYDVFYQNIPAILRNIIPNIYFDDKLIITSHDLKNRSFKKDILENGVYYIMDKLLDELASIYED